MKNIIQVINKYKFQILLTILIGLYITYFCWFTILRYNTLYASYFDLGIMHQTVFNTYRAFTTGDFSRILELTNPYGPEQIKRMSIHNDILLAFLAPFYFIYAGPETLLIIQTVVLALGAWFIFKIARIILHGMRGEEAISFVLAVAYLLYPALDRSNMFDFHPVVLATTFLLCMFYFWLIKKYAVSFLFLILSLLTKEEVGFTIAFFGMYVLFHTDYTFRLNRLKERKEWKRLFFPLLVMIVGIVWTIVSVSYVIPHFRGGKHFALDYYSDFGTSPFKVLLGIVRNPQTLAKYVFTSDVFQYIKSLFGPVGYISLLSPFTLFIALPELAINILSRNANMRNIYYHYTAAITPWIFIAAVYGVRRLMTWLKDKKIEAFGSELISNRTFPYLLVIYLLVFSVVFAYALGPLPQAKMQEVHPYKYPQKEYKDIQMIAKKLSYEDLKISSTGQLAPFFTSRRYFYTFSQYYSLADYIVLRSNEVYNYPEKDILIPVLQKLQKDQHFEKIFDENDILVYKKKE